MSSSPPVAASDDPAGSSPSPDRLRLREGTELLGRYEGSAYEQPTYLVRRNDGQVIHFSHLLYLVASLLDGSRDVDAIADEASAQLGRQVTAENVEYLVVKKLAPAGLVASSATADQAAALTRSIPLLALRYRKQLIPARLHRSVTTALQPLFWPPIVLLVLGGLVAVNVWLFATDPAGLPGPLVSFPSTPTCSCS